MSKSKKERGSATFERVKSGTIEWTRTLAEALIIVLFLRYFVIAAHTVPTASMKMTIAPGDYLLAEKISYRIEEPDIGDLVVFEYPLNPRVDFVKRCVATEGDIVEIKDKVLYVNGEKSPYQGRHVDPRAFPASRSPRDNYGPHTVAKDAIFCMGDNRDNSKDSRYWGDVPLENVKGRPIIIYYSTKMIGNMAKRRSSGVLTIGKNIFSLIKSFFFPHKVRYWRILKILN